MHERIWGRDAKNEDMRACVVFCVVGGVGGGRVLYVSVSVT